MIDRKNLDVYIRPWTKEDLPLLERLMGDPNMTLYIGGPETKEKIYKRHERYCRDSDLEQNPMFAVLLGPENIKTGSIGYWEKEWKGRPIWETGWSILPEFQGYGIATRAIALVIRRAQLEGKYRFLHAFPSVDNIASNAVCRKAGFTLEEEVNFEYPPGHLMQCNDWKLDLFTDNPTA